VLSNSQEDFVTDKCMETAIITWGYKLCRHYHMTRFVFYVFWGKIWDTNPNIILKIVFLNAALLKE